MLHRLREKVCTAEWSIPLAAAILAFAILFPTLSSGLAGDDIYRAHLAAAAKLHNWTDSQLIEHVSHELAAEHGGFFPLRSWPLWIWLSDPGPPIAHLIQIAAVSVNLTTFVFLILRLTGSRALSSMTLGLFLLSLQIRIPYDGLIGTLFLQPLILECVLLALLGWILYQRSRNHRWLFLAFIAYLGAIGSDEWTYAVAPVYLLLSRNNAEKRMAFTFFIPPIAFLAASCIGWTSLPASYSRIVHDMHDMGSYWHRAATQLLAPFPSIFRATGNLVPERRSLFTAQGDARFLIIPSLTFLGWLVALSVSSVIYRSFKRLPIDVPNCSWRPAMIVALFLWITPTIFVVVNVQEWHHYFPLGESYSTAYPLSFGFALAAAIVLASLSQFFRKHSSDVWLSTAAVVAFGAFWIEYGNQRADAFVIQKYAKLDLPRAQIAEAAHASLFIKIPEGNRIVVTTKYPFRVHNPGYRDARYLFFHYSGRRYNFASSAEIESGGRLCIDQNSMLCKPLRADTWLLRLGQPVHKIYEPALVLARWKYSDGQEIYTDKAIGYRAYGVADIRREATHESAGPLQGVQIATHEVQPYTLLLSAVRTCGPVSVQEAYIPNEAQIRWHDFFPLTHATSARIAGVVNTVSLPELQARVAGAQSALLVERDPCSPEPMEFHATVFTEAPATLWVTVGTTRTAFPINAFGTSIIMPIPTTLGRRFTVRFSTDATSIAPFLYGPRDDRAQFLDPRIVVTYPTLTPIIMSHG